MEGIWGSARPAAMPQSLATWPRRIVAIWSQDCVRRFFAGTTYPQGGFRPIQSRDQSETRIKVVRREQEDEDLIGSAMRRAYRVQSRMPEKFEELLRRLAQKEGSAPDDR